MPGVRSIDVGTPADFAAEKSWDVLLLLRFDDLHAVDVYRAHENHRPLHGHVPAADARR